LAHKAFDNVSFAFCGHFLPAFIKLFGVSKDLLGAQIVNRGGGDCRLGLAHGSLKYTIWHNNHFPTDEHSAAIQASGRRKLFLFYSFPTPIPNPNPLQGNGLLAG
jgi:hypothetical protein